MMCVKNALCVSPKTTLKSVGLCEKPEPPYCVPNPINISLETYRKNRKTLLRGNITISENVNLFVKFSSQVTENGKTKDLLRLEKVSCKQVITKIIYTATHLNYDADTCKVFKGNYTFDSFDVNALDQGNRFAPRLVGLNTWRVGFYDNKGSYVCAILVVEMKL